VSSRKPPWWRAFDKAERAVGQPLEDAAASNWYVDAMVLGMRAQRVVVGGVARAVGGAMGRVLRVANIPTRTDVRRLSQQLATLTTEIRTLSTAQEQMLAARKSPRSADGAPTTPIAAVSDAPGPPTPAVSDAPVGD
jgi:hypothetical protein